jgi:hypothetical protein
MKGHLLSQTGADTKTQRKQNTLTQISFNATTETNRYHGRKEISKEGYAEIRQERPRG